MTFVVEEQRIATRDEWVRHELELAGLPTEGAHAIAEGCEDLTRALQMGWFEAVRRVIDAWMQYGTWGPLG